MAEDETPERDVLPDAHDDEIEILEVIGLDEDSPAARPLRPRRPKGSPDDAVVVLEHEERGGEHDEPARAESAPEPPLVPRQDADDAERVARLTADFEGLRRRVEREREAHERQAAARLVARLLPVLDNFERALGGARGTPGASFRDGMALVFRQLLEELRKEGLTAVDSMGEPFDPAVHEAVATEHAPELPPHTVVEELQRGYLLHDRLLRPALVKVTLDPAAEDAPADGSEEP